MTSTGICSSKWPQNKCGVTRTDTLVFPVDVLQVKTVVALADVAAEGVDALAESGAHGDPGGALVHVCENGDRKIKDLD